MALLRSLGQNFWPQLKILKLLTSPQYNATNKPRHAHKISEKQTLVAAADTGLCLLCDLRVSTQKEKEKKHCDITFFFY